YVGGKKRRWRPRSDKQVVIGIRQRNGDLRLIRAEDAKSETVRQIINANIGGHVEVIMTDESAIYPWALDKMQKKLHKTINHTREYAHGDVHTNTVESAFSLLKRDRKSTRLNSSHGSISYAVFCLKKKKNHSSKPKIRMRLHSIRYLSMDSMMCSLPDLLNARIVLSSNLPCAQAMFRVSAQETAKA